MGDRDLKTYTGQCHWSGAGSGPGTEPFGSHWQSPAYSGVSTNEGYSFFDIHQPGLGEEYFNWLNSLPADLFPPGKSAFTNSDDVRNGFILCVSPGIPDRIYPAYKTIFEKGYCAGSPYDADKNPGPSLTPYIDKFGVLEGEIPNFEADFGEPFTMVHGQFNASTPTAKPGAIDLKYYNFGYKLYGDGTIKFLNTNHYNKIWGEAVLGLRNYIGIKTYIYSTIRIDEFVQGWTKVTTATPYGKFKGEFNDCYFNACQVLVEEANNCQFFDENVKASDTDNYPRYSIKGGKLDNTVIAVRFSDLEIGDAIRSLVRLNMRDLKFKATLDHSWIRANDETNLNLQTPIVAEVDGGMCIRTMIADGEYTIGEFNATSCSFSNMTITATKLTITDVQASGSLIEAADLRMPRTIALKDSTLRTLGTTALRNCGFDHGTVNANGEAIMEFSNVSQGGSVIMSPGSVMVSSSVTHSGTLVMEDGAQIDSCWLDSSVTVTIAAGAKIVGKDLGLRSRWSVADGDPEAEINYTPLDDEAETVEYGIPIKAIDLEGCIIYESTYAILTGSAQAYFREYTPAVYNYTRIVKPGASSYALENESELVYKSTVEELPIEVSEELAALGIFLGCSARKWYWRLTYPYAGQVIDPRI